MDPIVKGAARMAQSQTPPESAMNAPTVILIVRKSRSGEVRRSCLSVFGVTVYASRR